MASIRRCICALTVLSVMATPALAGWISGAIREAPGGSAKERPIPAGTTIEVVKKTASGEEPVKETTTTAKSAYRVFVKNPGPYVIRVHRHGRKKPDGKGGTRIVYPSLAIVAFKEPAQYNLVLVKQSDGKWELRRR
jgi:hypothetical protein